MKKLVLLSSLLISLTFLVKAQTNTWVIDNMHSNIGFKISHMGISLVEGEFNDFSGTITASKEDFSDAKADILIKAASINTDVQPRDEHLRSADFFDVEKYPDIHFVSTKIERAYGNIYQLSGNLSMHGVTKPVVLDVTYLGQAYEEQMKVQKAGFMVKGVLNRDEFGISSFNFPMPSGAPMVGREVFLNISLELIQK
ncbi:MAG: YceI family protein [Bacteroidetes bacterium 38_7]|nr:MAG: YceI family protein [Bacteroidetes bacterium 38_7]HAL65078.1 polyisoprenoid-binding protein [Bacteroidales bacterium]